MVPIWHDLWECAEYFLFIIPKLFSTLFYAPKFELYNLYQFGSFWPKMRARKREMSGKHHLVPSLLVLNLSVTLFFLGSPCGSAGKESTCNVGDLGLIPGLGRASGEGKGYSLQYSGLENSMYCIVHGVAKSRTWLSDFHFHFMAHCRSSTLVILHLVILQYFCLWLFFKSWL